MKEKSYVLLLNLFLISIFFINGCKDESEPLTPPSTHFEPEGWIIRDATSKPILVVWQGVIQKNWEGTAISDTLFAPLNALSDHYSVKFLDANKKIMSQPTGADYKLGTLVGDTAIFNIIQDNPTDWAFHLKGKKIGYSNLELQVQHIGHVDVKTPKIPVKTVLDTNSHGEPIGIRLSYEEDATVLVTATSSSSTGMLSVKKDSTSEHIKVEFFDENNKFFQPEYPLHKLGVSIIDTSIVKIIQETDEPWVIRLLGLRQGTTSVTFSLIVGGNTEFRSSAVLIMVE